MSYNLNASNTSFKVHIYVYISLKRKLFSSDSNELSMAEVTK